MAQEKQDIGILIENETAKRLDIMEQPGYTFPPRAGKRDAAIIVAAILVCGALILGCMTGVIA